MTDSELPKRPDLIAIDGSPAAEAAARYAIADAHHDERPIVFVQVIDGANPEGEAIAKPSITSALAAAAKAGVTADVRTRHGPPCEEIIAAARELDPRFIFIGTCGVKGFTRVLLGSVSADLLRQGDRPLVVVPPAALPHSSPDPLFARILVAVDPESEKTSPVESAIALAAATSRELVFCAVFDELRFLEMAADGGGFGLQDVLADVRSEARRTVEAAAAQARAHGVMSKALVLDADPVTALCSAADQHAATCILMCTHGRKGLVRMFLGSTTEGVLARSTIPVVAVRPGHVIGSPPFRIERIERP